jgi:hypothetical protein
VIDLHADADQRAQAFARRRADFRFVRLRYASGDWDVDQRMPANLLHSLLEYTTVEIDTREHVVDLSSAAVLDWPFAYLAGHRLVQFDRQERSIFERFVRNGGFLFADDCNHDIDGLFARSFEAQLREIFGESALRKLPKTHDLYSALFPSPTGRPRRVSSSTAGATTWCMTT